MDPINKIDICLMFTENEIQVSNVYYACKIFASYGKNSSEHVQQMPQSPKMERHSCLTNMNLIILGAFSLDAVIKALYEVVNPIHVVEISLYAL